jgi:hypothetical protein
MQKFGPFINTWAKGDPAISRMSSVHIIVCRYCITYLHAGNLTPLLGIEYTPNALMVALAISLSMCVGTRLQCNFSTRTTCIAQPVLAIAHPNLQTVIHGLLTLAMASHVPMERVDINKKNMKVFFNSVYPISLAFSSGLLVAWVSNLIFSIL